jgi:DNA repair protein RadC
MKSKIQGRGMDAVRELFGMAERSRAPRLTFYNHEEELHRVEALAAENKRVLKIACEAANRLISEEAEYVKMVTEAELARIAAEAELKRLADEEALKLLLDRAVRIADVKTQRINQEQHMGPPRDIVMQDISS